jgi:hypothetical protein
MKGKAILKRATNQGLGSSMASSAATIHAVTMNEVGLFSLWLILRFEDFLGNALGRNPTH